MNPVNLSRLAAALALSAAALAGPAWAQHAAGADHGSPGSATAGAAGAATAEAMSSAEIRRIDRSGGKLTLRHGEIANLDMPPMTMVFRVRDAAMLDGLKEGDRIRFRAEKDGSQYVVTRLARE